MERTQAIDRTLIVDAICEAVQEQILEGAEAGEALPDVEEDTVLFGQDGLLDSLGLVSAILEIEERVRAAFGVSIVVADDRAMSQTRSPFRSVRALADYVTMLLQEQR
jgi:acyl carrier protein